LSERREVRSKRPIDFSKCFENGESATGKKYVCAMQQNVTKENFNLQFTFNLHEEAVSEKINIFFLPSFQ